MPPKNRASLGRIKSFESPNDSRYFRGLTGAGLCQQRRGRVWFSLEQCLTCWLAALFVTCPAYFVHESLKTNESGCNMPGYRKNGKPLTLAIFRRCLIAMRLYVRKLFRQHGKTYHSPLIFRLANSNTQTGRGGQLLTKIYLYLLGYNSRRALGRLLLSHPPAICSSAGTFNRGIIT